MITLTREALSKLLSGVAAATVSWRATPIASVDALVDFLDTRAAHVGQSSLYGYLKARSGIRHPEIFTNDRFVASINIAKWHVYLACVSDLAVFAGGQAMRRADGSTGEISDLIRAAVERVLARHGRPAEAGEGFAAAADAVRARIDATQWQAVPDDETVFTASPTALYHWAPVFEELKVNDEEIVRNSIRFKWRDVRERLRRDFRADELLADWRRVARPED